MDALEVRCGYGHRLPLFSHGVHGSDDGDSFSGLNPLVIIPSIFKIWREYLLVVLLIVGIVLAENLAQAGFSRLAGIPILPGLIGEFLALYLGAVVMRLLGLIYWNNRAQLSWFSR